MSLSIFLTEHDFIFASAHHLLAVLICAILGWVLIYYAKHYLSFSGQRKLMLAISLVPLITLVFSTVLNLALGNFDYQTDLPIHLCRLLAIASPFIYLSKNRFWKGVFYFWIVVGTFNAIVTPDLKYTHPHWEFIVYFIMHGFLVILAIYNVIIFSQKIIIKDIWNAFWMSNLLLVITLFLNLLIGSNYMFTKHKPEAATLLDYFGPWPFYLITVQFIGLGFFFLAYLPFFLKKKWLN